MANSETENIRILVKQTRLMNKLERAFARDVAREKNKYIVLQADNYRRSRSLSDELTVNHKIRLTAIFRKHHLRTLRIFSEDVKRDIQKAYDALDIEQKRTLFDTLLMEWINLEGANKIALIAGTTFNDLRKVLQAGLDAEEPAPRIIKQLLQVRAFSRFRALTIARTETHNAAMFASKRSAEVIATQTGLTIKKKWIPALDERTRTDHAAMSGKPAIPMDSKFIVGGVKMDRPGDPTAPASQIINCLHPDSIVWAASPNALTRRFYEGVLFKIQTANGYDITVTPNHPILTRRGWVAASEIKKTDSIICANRSEWERLGYLNIENIMPKIEQIYNSSLVIFPSMRVGRINVNFHGEIPDKDVDIVFENGSLNNRLKSFFRDPLQKFPFSHANFGKGLVLRNCLAFMPLHRSFHAFSSFVSSLNLIYSFFLSHSRPFNLFRFALPSGSDSVRYQSSIDSAPIKSCDFGNSINRNARFKKSNNFGNMFVNSRVIGHEKIPYRGYVYNLSDDKGYYICNGIVNHNCRCVLVYEPEG